MKRWCLCRTSCIAPGICVLLGFLQGCGESKTTPVPTDPSLPVLERQVEDLSRQIDELQEKVRATLVNMVKEIEDGNIDSEAEVARVNETLKELQSMRRTIQKYTQPPQGPTT